MLQLLHQLQAQRSLTQDCLRGFVKRHFYLFGKTFYSCKNINFAKIFFLKIENRIIKQVAAGIWVHPSMIFASKLRLEPKGQCGPLWTYDSQRHRRRDFGIRDNRCYLQSLVNDSPDIKLAQMPLFLYQKII